MKDRYDDIDEYIGDLQAEIRTNDQCATHYYNLGVALLAKGDFVEAEEAFLSAEPNSPCRGATSGLCICSAAT